MIPRKLAAKLRELAGYYPVVVVTGPRQSGKTTLCQATFPDRPYLSLEALDTREFAHSDPRGFLAQYADGAIFDEIQHVPKLLNYLQGEVDARPDERSRQIGMIAVAVRAQLLHRAENRDLA